MQTTRRQRLITLSSYEIVLSTRYLRCLHALSTRYLQVSELDKAGYVYVYDLRSVAVLTGPADASCEHALLGEPWVEID